VDFKTFRREIAVILHHDEYIFNDSSLRTRVYDHAESLNLF